MKHSKLVAIDDTIGCGAIMYWTLTGDVKHSDLKAALVGAGLGHLCPKQVTEEQALKRALDEVKDKRVLIRNLKGKGRWAVVLETVDGDALRYAELFRATVVGDTLNLTRRDFPTGDSEAAKVMQTSVRIAYEHAMTVLAQRDISGWLSKQVVPALDAVALRDSGGVYFVPKDKVALMDKIAGVLGTEQTIYRIPAMNAATAADAVLAAIETESTTAITEIETWLADNTERQERSIKAREGIMVEVKEKLTRYETLFGRRMTEMHNRLAKVRNTLAGVSVTLDAAAEGRETTGRVLDLRDDVAPDTGAEVPDTDAGVERFRQLEID